MAIVVIDACKLTVIIVADLIPRVFGQQVGSTNITINFDGLGLDGAILQSMFDKQRLDVGALTEMHRDATTPTIIKALVLKRSVAFVLNLYISTTDLFRDDILEVLNVLECQLDVQLGLGILIQHSPWELWDAVVGRLDVDSCHCVFNEYRLYSVCLCHASARGPQEIPKHILTMRPDCFNDVRAR